MKRMYVNKLEVCGLPSREYLLCVSQFLQFIQRVPTYRPFTMYTVNVTLSTEGLIHE